MRLLAIFVALMSAISAVHSGESMLATTFQPLDGLGSGTIKIVEVTCHDWYGMSGQPTSIGLISVPNIPPTNSPKEANENLNLASACGLRFTCEEVDSTLELSLDATAFSIPNRFGHPKEEILKASLECLRRCLPDKLLKAQLSLRTSDADKDWMIKIVDEFNAHDRTKVFFTPEE